MNEHSYVLLSTMRGPDHISCVTIELKALFTARLRSVVFPPTACYGDYDESELTPDNFRVLIWAFKSDPVMAMKQWVDADHYIAHLQTALELHYNGYVVFPFLKSWSRDALGMLVQSMNTLTTWTAEDYVQAFSSFHMVEDQVVHKEE